MKYVIFGSGGLAKELIDYVQQAGHQVVAVVSTEYFSNPAFEQFKVRASIRPDEFPDAQYLMGVAEPWIKRKIVSENADRWATFIAPSAYISGYAKVGKGCIIAPHALICGDGMIDDFVFMNTNSTVGHDSIICSYTTMFPNTEVCGNCLIGEGCIFGIGSYVLPNVTLPAGTKVSAGAVVRKSVMEPCTLYGDPARPLIKEAA